MASKPYTKVHRLIVREQLLRCQTPRQILRVLAVALQRKESANELPRMDAAIVRALYRSRIKATDHEVLGVINIIVLRFIRDGLSITPYLLAIGIKFAARSRSLPGMKRYLKLYREMGRHMTKNLFRAIIAKFSIGNNGFGEIRNGRWNRQDLLQVLLGFEDASPGDQHHLGLFLDRSEWTTLIAWITVLARCKASDVVWEEWLLWKQNPARWYPKMLKVYEAATSLGVNKGDHGFIEAMADSGDIRRAWLILEDSKIPYNACKQSLRYKLVRKVQFAASWDEQMSIDLLNIYAAELTKMETALGVEWVSLGDDQGYHRPVDHLYESLRNLSAPNFKLERDPYGYPYDKDAAGRVSSY